MKFSLQDQVPFIEGILTAKESSRLGVLKSGQMAVNMKGSGKTDKHVVKVDFGMPTVTPMKVNGCKIKQTDMVCTYTQTEPNIWVIGKMMFNMVEDRKLGQMVQGLKAITRRERNTVKELTTGQMDLRLPGAGPTTKLMGMESTCGQMVESSKATGKITTCTARESTLGPMAAATKEIMKMIRSMDMAFTLGATVVSIAEIG